MGQNNQCLTYFGDKLGFEKWPEKGPNATFCKGIFKENHNYIVKMQKEK